MLSEADRRWNSRFDRRQQQGLLRHPEPPFACTLRWSGPVRGIDGEHYHPGVDHTGAPVLAVFSSGYQETVPAMSPTDDWAVHRAHTDGRFHALSTWRPTRVDREDLVLAYLVQRPRELADLGSWVPTDTFTSHTRCAIYEAMLALHTAAQPVTPDAIESHVQRSIDELSPRLARLVTETTDTIAYLHRLLLTPSTSVEALDAAIHLVAADWKMAADFGRPDFPDFSRALPPQYQDQT
ncbi:DnaB-like helicase N-terminal domain-containing protein [Kitasatospora phosalacinea]|uniref:DNA helicase DnaB-like N-terminal domain-containing protein n=1 Tax=Kitasatospora phosalacinea TaxID=2065 RepID=A0A9W6UTE2_9ACTN|nr:DnaB-like helicase N-terminal domain-containing protein [Kitasatospora phosalacinea]GLW58515.1 hypothetical protein Kpho01_65260 [Kitasatospora phosalacinea]